MWKMQIMFFDLNSERKLDKIILQGCPILLSFELKLISKFFEYSRIFFPMPTQVKNFQV
jgi:hypothetical protein